MQVYNSLDIEQRENDEPLRQLEGRIMGLFLFLFFPTFLTLSLVTVAKISKNFVSILNLQFLMAKFKNTQL